MQTSAQTTQPSISPRPVALDETWIEIRSSRGRLLCRLDVERMLLEVKPKGQPAELVDLRPHLGRCCGQECNKLIDLTAVAVVD